MPQIMTVREVAKFFRLKEATVCRLASEGKLPAFKVGKSWRFDMEEIQRTILSSPQDSGEESGSNHGD